MTVPNILLLLLLWFPKIDSVDGGICSRSCSLGVRTNDSEPCFLAPCSRRDDEVAVFQGNSYLFYTSQEQSASMLHMFVRFKLQSMVQSGLILFRFNASECRATPCRHYLQLHVESGHVALTWGTSQGEVRLTSSHTLALHTWHDLQVSITGRLVRLVLDNISPTRHRLTKRWPSLLDLNLDMYVGGTDRNHQLHNHQGQRVLGLVGVVAAVRVNFRRCQLSVGSLRGAVMRGLAPSVHEQVVTKTMPQAQLPMFRGHQYKRLHLTDFPEVLASPKIEAKLEVFLTVTTGLLLFFHGNPGVCYCYVIVKDGHLHLCCNWGEGEGCLRGRRKLTRRTWYQIEVRVVGTSGELFLNSMLQGSFTRPGHAMNLVDPVFIGGLPLLNQDVLHLITNEPVVFQGLRGFVHSIIVCDEGILMSNSIVSSMLSPSLSAVSVSVASEYQEVKVYRDDVTILRCDYRRAVPHGMLWSRDGQALSLTDHLALVHSDSGQSLYLHPNLETDVVREDLQGFYTCAHSYQGVDHVVQAYGVVHVGKHHPPQNNLTKSGFHEQDYQVWAKVEICAVLVICLGLLLVVIWFVIPSCFKAGEDDDGSDDEQEEHDDKRYDGERYDFNGYYDGRYVDGGYVDGGYDDQEYNGYEYGDQRNVGEGYWR